MKTFLVFYENGKIGVAVGEDLNKAYRSFKKDHPDMCCADIREIRDINDLAVFEWNAILNSDMVV